MNRNLFKFGAEFALGAPKVIGLLHPQPQSGSIAAEPAEPRGHRGSNRYLLGHNSMKRLSRYAELARCLADRETKRREHILAQDRAGMCRLSRRTIFRCSLSDHSWLPVGHLMRSGRSAVTQPIVHIGTNWLRASSMILLQVNLPRVTLIPFERDTPRTIQVKAITLRLSPEGMEIEARDVEIAQRRSVSQRIQSSKRPALEVRAHPSAPALVKQLLEPLVAEAPYH